MAEYLEEHVITEIIKEEDKKHGELPPKVHIPKLNSFFIHCLFFLLGICRFISLTFFAASTTYWLNKFKDASNTDNSASNRTFMQVNFASANQVCSTLSSLTFGIFNMTIAHRFSLVSRVICAMFMQIFVFGFFALGVELDTTSYQVLFFCLVLLASACLSGASTVNMVASLSMYPRFPHKYMKTSLVGEGCVGVIGDSLNILSLFLFNNDINKATMMYFLMACGLLIVTIVLFFIMMSTESFKLCMSSVTVRDKNSIPSLREIKQGFRMIRFPCIIAAYIMTAMAATHTSVTSLVISEDYDTNSTWAATYFSPVMTYLLADVGLLVGRFIITALPIITKTPEPYFYVIGGLRLVVMVPFIWMCNAQPRHHLPVLFPHDYQYGIILVVFMITSGIGINWPMMLIARTIKKEDADMAYNVFSFTINVVQTALSPIGIFIVNLL